ncbi:hypothetical protein IL306_002219, partial [Fusarium sp. DS 682]
FLVWTIRSSVLKKEVQHLENLSYIKETAEIMDIAVESGNETRAINSQYNDLRLKTMARLDPSADEFQNLEKYLTASCGDTYGMKYSVTDIFRIEREGESERFNDFCRLKTGSLRRLLWHGAPLASYGGILKHGLRTAPAEAPMSGYSFGKGIYLTDISYKAASSCHYKEYDGEALLLLCEAVIGYPFQKCTEATYNASIEEERCHYSTLGLGKYDYKYVSAEKIDSRFKDTKKVSPFILHRQFLGYLSITSGHKLTSA